MEDRRSGEGDGMHAVAIMHERTSTASELLIRVPPSPLQQLETGYGTLILPGWIRERSAELLFMGGDVDESSVAEVILDSLLKVKFAC